jgi:hypothetical protein
MRRNTPLTNAAPEPENGVAWDFIFHAAGNATFFAIGKNSSFVSVQGIENSEPSKLNAP